MATDAVVFWVQTRWRRDCQKSSSKKFKNSKKMLETKIRIKAHTKCSWGKDTFSTRARLQEATKCSKSSHLTLQKNNFLASYYKRITAWWFPQGIGINIALDISSFPKYHLRHLRQIPLEPCYYIHKHIMNPKINAGSLISTKIPRYNKIITKF